MIGELGFLSLHHLCTILGSKYGFLSTNIKQMVAKLPHTTAVATHRQSHIPSLVKIDRL